MEEKSTMKEQLAEINQKLPPLKKSKKRRFKLPMKAKVGKVKLKKGYMTIEVINENKEIAFIKEPIVNGTIKIEDTSGNISVHAIDELDVFTYRGRPFAHLPKIKINPWNPLGDYLNTERVYDGKKLSRNEIYGQKYVMARMKADFITGAKKKMGMGISIFGIIIAAIIAYAFLTGK